MKNILKNKKFIISISIIVIIILSVLFTLNKGVIHTKGVKVYYRTYTKEKGWSSWRKNGQISGDKKHKIVAVEMKVKSKSSGHIFYNVYSNSWQINDCYDQGTCGNVDDDKYITGLKVAVSDTLFKKYDTIYRIYTNNWSDYSENFKSAGKEDNKSYITAIQIKIVDKVKK